jgi:hypothetical protein
VLGQNSGVRAVSADISQPIKKIIGIGCLTLADTINHIFGIGYTMSADTNNVSGIRGVTPLTRNPNHSEICFCTVRMPNFPALYAAASLDADVASLYAAPSTSPPSVPPPPPSTPHHRCRRHQPYFLVALPSASTLPAMSPSSSPTPSPSLTPSHHPQLLL